MVYVDYIVLARDDAIEMEWPKKNLVAEIGIKDLGSLK